MAEERLITITDRDGVRICVLEVRVAIRYDEEHGTNLCDGRLDLGLDEARALGAEVAAWLIVGGDNPDRPVDG